MIERGFRTGCRAPLKKLDLDEPWKEAKTRLHTRGRVQCIKRRTSGLGA